MSTTSFINSLIASPHRAQLIHQRGKLIFANSATAAAFGIPSVEEFVTFAESTQLFVDATPPAGSMTRTRTLSFRSLDGQRKLGLVSEHLMSWNGHPSAYLTIDLLGQDGAIIPETELEQSLTNEDTYFLDSIDAAMDWSRSEGRAYESVSKPFDFAGLCLRLSDDLAPLAEQQGVTLNVIVKPRALNMFIGDGPKLARIVACIVRYAISRNPFGRLDITLNASEKGDNISVEICDDGPSFTAWESVHLLQAPVDSSFDDDSSVNFAPLELPFASCLAQFLGGKLALKVNHSAGGLIRLRLPFQRADVQSRTGFSRDVDNQAMRILVAEDNPTSQQILKVILSALGHETTMVSDGLACVQALQQSAFDVVFMDLHMPVMDGYAATQRIRGLEAEGKFGLDGPIPILALTADRRDQTKLRAEKVGVSGFLTKPIHIPQILGALTLILAQRAQQVEALEEASRAA